LWFDPDTLELGAAISAGGSVSVAGTNAYTASAGGARAYQGPSTPITSALGDNGRMVLQGGNNTGQLRLTVPAAAMPDGNGSYYLATMGQTTGLTANWQYLFHFGLKSWATGGDSAMMAMSPIGGVDGGYAGGGTMGVVPGATGAMQPMVFGTLHTSTGTPTQGSVDGTNLVQPILNGTPVASQTIGASVYAKNDVDWAAAIGNVNQISPTSGWVGNMGDTVLLNGATTAAWRQEVDTYIAQKYATIGKAVTATSTATVNGVSTPSVYDLSAGASAQVLIDQVLNRQTAGTSGDTVLTAGADWVATGAGDDTVYVKDLSFRSIDGGQGNDTLALDSSYSTAGSMVLADFVSNARGMSGGLATPNSADVRVNAAGYHKLLGFEKIDLSQSTAAQALTVDAADVNQLSDTNTLGVVLGSNDSITATGFTGASPTWGYYNFNGVAYDQLWSVGSGANTYSLYARGTTPVFAPISGATSGSDNLAGTSGNNLLQGDLGNDTLTGGAAADVFKFVANDVGSDIITDFIKADGDKLDLTALLSGAGITGSNVAQYLNFSRVGATADAILKVDVQGAGGFVSPELSITLQGAWSTLSSDTALTLFNDRVILA